MRGGMIKAVFISPNVLMEPYRQGYTLSPPCHAFSNIGSTGHIDI